jgi:hypothetical protein
MHYSHDDEPARATNCGIATGFLTERLQSNHDIATQRLRGAPPLMPRTPFGRTFDHAILRHEDTLIDPTYGQLFEYAGIDRRNPNTRATDYPESLSLLVDLNDPDATLEPLAESLDKASRFEHAQASRFAPLRNLGNVAILDILRNTYDPRYYEPFPLETYLPSYDTIQSLVMHAKYMEN